MNSYPVQLTIKYIVRQLMLFFQDFKTKHSHRHTYIISVTINVANTFR